jgi:hypothetical protein
VQAEPQDIYRLAGALDVRGLAPLADLAGYDALRFPPRPPVATVSADEQADIFATLDAKDILLHHPYESFDPVVAFVDAAAEDPDVLAIKQTLYRTSGDSPIVAALTRAADAGKQVTVLVELMARFDESRNIRWARRLEEMGAHVIYGIRHYKVHSKICLVVRRTRAGLARYVHLGTGNYNDRTARLYTDLGLLTSNAQIGADASAFWSALTGYSDPPRLNKLAMAPTMLRERLIALIDRERRRAESGQPARIRAKMNSLIDADIVRALYRASSAGVDIELNVRGMCTLRPGVKGMSDRITVTSIVGRYLEHARAFVFHNGGDEEVYLASADWMGRNLDKRIELMFPIESPAAKRKVLDILTVLFRDNVKARRLGPMASGSSIAPRGPSRSKRRPTCTSRPGGWRAPTWASHSSRSRYPSRSGQTLLSTRSLTASDPMALDVQSSRVGLLHRGHQAEANRAVQHDVVGRCQRLAERVDQPRSHQRRRAAGQRQRHAVRQAHGRDARSQRKDLHQHRPLQAERHAERDRHQQLAADEEAWRAVQHRVQREVDERHRDAVSAIISLRRPTGPTAIRPAASRRARRTGWPCSRAGTLHRRPPSGACAAPPHR